MLNQVLKMPAGTCQLSVVNCLSKSLTFLDFRLSQGSVQQHIAGEVEIFVMYTQRIFLTNQLVKEF